MKINKLAHEELKDKNLLVYLCNDDYKLSSNIDNFLFKKDEAYTKQFLIENIKSFDFLIKCTSLKNLLIETNPLFLLKAKIEEVASEEPQIEEPAFEEPASEEPAFEEPQIVYFLNKQIENKKQKFKKGTLFNREELEKTFGNLVQELLDNGSIIETKRQFNDKNIS